jgi:EAL domain-containing protein (putative c-di-GMP-specific phosphodiesterase class I)/CheY-like chemotaxis protein
VLDESISVLVADDEPQLRLALADLLAHEEGMALVGTAGDADEAIAIAVSRKPDVALVDVKMPSGGGARATKEILRASPETRVIALSAFEDRPTVLEMLRAGAVGYLVKGTAADEIVASIAEVAQGGTSISAAVVGGIVTELSSQLRREESEREELAARRQEIERFITGSGVTMVFQPIMDLRSREVVGVEALARFLSLPPRSPAAWFAEAVSLQMSRQLEMSTVRQALAHLPEIQNNVYLSLNCSHRTVCTNEFSLLMADIGHRVVVEITEHEPVEDYEVLASALSRLRAQNVRIAIDDAGAGFASLRHTLQLGPDIVKVDLSLTRDIDHDRARRALASALISFADELGMTIVAEGIETPAELEALMDLGVRYGQGFFLAEPGPLP